MSFRLRVLMVLAALGCGTVPATAETLPPPLKTWPTVTIAIDGNQDYWAIRQTLRQMMNRHDFDLRGEGVDTLVFNRGIRYERRWAPPPIPDAGSDRWSEVYNSDLLFTQVAIHYVPDPTGHRVTVSAEPMHYDITFDYGDKGARWDINRAAMGRDFYARVLQRELEVIKASLENPPAPVIYQSLR